MKPSYCEKCRREHSEGITAMVIAFLAGLFFASLALMRQQ